MTIVTLSAPLNLNNTTIWDATLDSYSTTEIHMSNGTRHEVFTGHFAFNASSGEFSGTLNSVVTTQSGSPEYSFTGMDVDVNKLFAAVDGDDIPAASNLLFGGADVFKGSSGRDVLFADAGDDVMKGNLGNDLLKGQAGDDKLSGGGGRDRLLGGFGDDTLAGNQGNDVLFGEKGNDGLYGGAKSDKLYGGAGSDYLEGQKGNDFLSGGKGFDNLDGGSGADVLQGGLGMDDLRGGAGADVFLYSGAQDEGDDVIFDFVSGVDLVRIGGAVTFSDIAITGNEFETDLSWNDTTVVMFNVDFTTVTAADFDFI